MSSSLSSVREENEDGLLDAALPSVPPTAISPRRFHSRLHSRNLSVFFPRPDATRDGATTPVARTDCQQPALDVGGTSDVTPGGTTARSTVEHSVTRPAQRRGHHHRHSVSLSIPPPGPRIAGPGPAASDAAELDRESRREEPPAQRGQHTSSIVLVLAVVQVALGAYLWVQGQRLESLSTTGLGYVVVFDGAAVVLAARYGTSSGVMRGAVASGLVPGGREASETLRRPYGCVPSVVLSLLRVANLKACDT